MVNDLGNANNEQSVLLNADVRRKIVLLMRGHKDDKIEVPQHQQQQIAKNYMKTFYALAAINWTKGMVLGAAWQKALDQMNSFVVGKAKSPNNPVNKYLVGIHAQNRREISEYMMFSPNSDEKLGLDLAVAKVLLDYATKRFHAGLGKLNEIHAQYEPKTQENKDIVSKLTEQRTQDLMQKMKSFAQRFVIVR